MRLPNLIAKADRVFSQFVRSKYADHRDMVKCYTCDSWHKVQHIQAGHFISRVWYGVRWNEKNVKPQCVVCNYGHDDEVSKKFSLALRKEHGQGVVKELEGLKRRPLDRFEILEIIEKYK